MTATVSTRTGSGGNEISHDQEISRWGAERTLMNQDRFFRELKHNCAVETHRSIQEIAGRLGVEEDVARDAIEGRVDLTLTELRLLSAACGVIVDFHVSPVALEYKAHVERFNAKWWGIPGRGHDIEWEGTAPLLLRLAESRVG